VVEAAKGLRDFARTNPALVVKGGILDGNLLDAKEIARLADLESRDVLLGRLAGGMLASLSQAVYLLNAPLAQVARLAGALHAKAEEDPSVLGGGAGTPAATDAAATGEADAGEAAVEDSAVTAEAAAEAPAAPVEAADEAVPAVSHTSASTDISTDSATDSATDTATDTGDSTEA
jgi:large subunit ribosomal protein L10